MNTSTDFGVHRRRELLKVHHEFMAQAMRECRDTDGISDPVGLVIQLHDKMGSQLAAALRQLNGDSMPEPPKPGGDVALCQLNVVDIGLAKKLLPFTSPTALSSLSTPRPVGVYLIVVVAYGGNAYAGIRLDG